VGEVRERQSERQRDREWFLPEGRYPKNLREVNHHQEILRHSRHDSHVQTIGELELQREGWRGKGGMEGEGREREEG
jgi:hypothetical protein